MGVEGEELCVYCHGHGDQDCHLMGAGREIKFHIF
jgi:hypothetical protein